MNSLAFSGERTADPRFGTDGDCSQFISNQHDAVETTFLYLISAVSLLFDRQEPHDLVLPENPGPGVYALLDGDTVVYVGKTTNLRSRLRKHSRTIRDADPERLDPQRIKAKHIRLNPHLAVAFESYLIATKAPDWNTSGFGSNAHGSGRSNQRPSLWNERYGRAVTR